MLDAFLASIVKERTVVSRRWCVSILAVCDGIGGDGEMLWSVRCGVSIPSELFHDVVWHGKVNVSLVVILFQVGATT